MELYLHRPSGDPVSVSSIAKPTVNHRITSDTERWTTWVDDTPREIATIDELHVDLADLLQLAAAGQETVVVEGRERTVSYVFPGGVVGLLEVRSSTDSPGERDRTAYRSIDERDRAARAATR